MTSDPSLSVAISVIGAHYPARPSEAAYALQSGSHKPLWASEMWNLGNVNDYPGALQLAHDLGTQAVQGMSSSIVVSGGGVLRGVIAATPPGDGGGGGRKKGGGVGAGEKWGRRRGGVSIVTPTPHPQQWCLIHSWYSILPFSRTTDTNAGAGHALLTAAEPWSGHWQINPTLAAVAHHTQFAQPDWTYLAVGSGTGYIDAGNTSTIVALVNTNVPGGMLECSFVIETQHLPAPMSVTIALGGVAQGTVLPSVMHLWATVDEDHQLVALADVPVSGDGTVTFPVVPSAMYSLTTTTGQGFVVPAAPIAPSAAFPFPYSDSFTTYPSGGYPLYTADEGGLFVVDPTPPALGGAHALHQVVTQVPIVWERNPDPYTLLGNMNNFPSSGWSDYAVAITAAIDSAAAPQPPAGPSVASSMQPCNAASRSQQWAASTGALTASPALLVSVAYPGMCLGNTGATDYNASDTPTVGLVPCNLTVGASAGGTPTLHHWSLQGAHIVAAEGGQCLDVGGGSLAAGASAVTYGCKPPGGDDNQRWTVQGAPSAQQLRSTFDGMCLDLAPAPPPPPPVAPYLMLCARIGKYERNGPPPSGYCLTVTASANATASGAWALAFGTQRLASGATPTPVTQGTWHTLRVACAGDAVTASLDGATLGSGAVAGQKLSAYGMVALGSGWHEAWFKDLVIA